MASGQAGSQAVESLLLSPSSFFFLSLWRGDEGVEFRSGGPKWRLKEVGFEEKAKKQKRKRSHRRQLISRAGLLKKVRPACFQPPTHQEASKSLDQLKLAPL